MLFNLILLSAAAAQQVYIAGHGPSSRPSCSDQYQSHFSTASATPVYRKGNFSYTLTETSRIALPAQTSPTTTSFGDPYTAASTLLANVSTTCWGSWAPNGTKPTDTHDPYGQAAWSALWDNARLQNFTTGIYSTTASPIVIPTSSLIMPPPPYFQPSDNCYTFPEDFMLGVSSAAAQIEGAISDEGRSPAFPDILPAILGVEQSIVAQGVAYYGVGYDYTTIEAYYLYKRDIDRLAAVGMKVYSFSIAWTRILPFVLPGTPVNSQGIAHYEDLIDYAISKGMQVTVTLLHYDTPLVFYGNNYTQMVQDTKLNMANWDLQLANATLQDAFVNYGKIVMTHFADRVPVWFSFNEPAAAITGGAAADNVLKAHARLAHFYREELRGTGRFSMKMSSAPGVPLIPTNASHVAAVQHYNDLNIGTFYDTLILGHDYPSAFKMTIQDYVPLSQEDLAYMKGTIDLVAVDYYWSNVISPAVDDIAACATDNSSSNPLYPNCVTSAFTNRFGWEVGPYTDYIGLSTPTYMRQGLSYLWDRYDLPLVISEFGTTDYNVVGSPSALYFDQYRSDYYVSYLNEVLKAIWEDGVHVMGTLAWSYADNWEWGTFNHKLGFQAVNMTSQERTYKRSIFDYVDFYQSRGGKR